MNMKRGFSGKSQVIIIIIELIKKSKYPVHLNHLISIFRQVSDSYIDIVLSSSKFDTVE